MKTLKIALSLAVLVALFLFSLYNAQPVQVSFFQHQSPQVPLFLVLIFSFFLGFLLAALWGTVRVSYLRRQIHQLRREKEPARPAVPADRSGQSARETPGQSAGEPDQELD